MTTAASVQSINIRPGVSILSVLRHLNYRPWFAMAEFVDNSLQSFLDYRDELGRVEGLGFKLKVTINLDTTDSGRITIRDNAAGIHEADYRRAFRPAEIPPDQSGLCEFGMGMKSAACWFAPQWTVRTSALGEAIERTVTFNIEKIVRDEIDELTVHSRVVQADIHFTEIVLENLHRFLIGRTVGKIKEHLASIYRKFIGQGILELWFDDELLKYNEPKILFVPFYKTPSGTPGLWRKEIDFDFGRGLSAKGFAAIRETASTSGAGFALFRRARLIQGSADEGYRPEFIFKKSNSFTYQRLFGELELEGFDISHTKDGFRWDENEETFLQLLKDALDEEPLPLLEQAEGHRVRSKPEDWKKGAETAVQRTVAVIQHDVPPVIEKQLAEGPDTKAPPGDLPPATSASRRVIDVELNDTQWQVVIELSDDPAVGDWVEICDQTITEDEKSGNLVRCVGVRLALAHPFTERFGGASASEIEPLLRIAAAIGLAEIVARDSGVKWAGTFRRTVNDLLRDALSKP